MKVMKLWNMNNENNDSEYQSDLFMWPSSGINGPKEALNLHVMTKLPKE